jgi:hypothetical protein
MKIGKNNFFAGPWAAAGKATFYLRQVAWASALAITGRPTGVNGFF